jgi:hypothetical protein
MPSFSDLREWRLFILSLHARTGPRNIRKPAKAGMQKDQTMKQTIQKTLRISFALAALAAARLEGASVISRFDTDPITSGWQSYGNSSLFTWNSTNKNLQVTWDSSQPNSYFARSLGRTLSRTNDFLIEFDLKLADITPGTDSLKPYGFEIALSLIHHSQLTNTDLSRGSGSAPNIIEFDYFPNDTNNFGATVSTALISDITNYWSGGFSFPVELQTNAAYHVQMTFTATNQTLHTTITSNGIPIGPLSDATIAPDFGDFAVDTIAVSSYSDQGQDPSYAGSVLAHGTVGNIVVASPLPVGTIGMTTPGQVSLLSDADWSYTLETSSDLQSWTAAAPPTMGNGTNLVLQTAILAPGKAFYRVRAALPP